MLLLKSSRPSIWIETIDIQREEYKSTGSDLRDCPSHKPSRSVETSSGGSSWKLVSGLVKMFFQHFSFCIYLFFFKISNNNIILSMFYRHRKLTNRQIPTKKIKQPQTSIQNIQDQQLSGNTKYYEIIQQQYSCVFKRCGFRLFQVLQHEKGLLKNCLSLLQAMSALPLYFYSKKVEHPCPKKCFLQGETEMWMETKYSITSQSLDEKEEARRKLYEEQINSFLVENLIPKLQVFKKINLSLQSLEQQQFSSSEEVMRKFKKEIMDNIDRQFKAYTSPR